MSSNLNRTKIRKMILKEFKMMGMTDMSHGGMQPMGFSDPRPDMHMGHGHNAMKSTKNCVSREDCCAAIMCLVECCDCPITKKMIMECCQDIMSGAYDNQ